MQTDYKTQAVSKPWGEEYLVYDGSEVQIWYLDIKPGKSTSLHCHPNKNTGLIMLSGWGRVEFLSGAEELKLAPYKTMIRAGVFHSTYSDFVYNNRNGEGLKLFEIETSKDRNDLVRMRDEHGRENEAYETTLIDKPEGHLWIEKEGLYRWCGYYMTLQALNQDECLSVTNREIIIVLEGYLMAGNNIITKPGDTISGESLKKLVTAFPLGGSHYLFCLVIHNSKPLSRSSPTAIKI